MLKTLLFLISIFFICLKFIKTKIFKWGHGDTFIGYVLTKQNYVDFLKLYLSLFNTNYILITGTNGKTSTTSLATHLLSSTNYTYLSNSTGSNLERGILSTLVLNLPKFVKKSPDYMVLEVDEASVPIVLNKLSKNVKSLSLIILNLSRDQLDRYAEIDLLATKINDSIKPFKNSKVYITKGDYVSYFKNPTYVKTHSVKRQLLKKLKVQNNFIESNLDFVLTVFSDLGININPKSVTAFTMVDGRGKVFNYAGINYEIHLTKNPVSFNNNLLHLKNVSSKNIAVYVNDFIPDGRDVSWFYDIDYNLLKTVFKNKRIYVLGSRSYDFYNFLNILEINSFNLVSFSNMLIYFKKLSAKDVYVLSNYSATVNLVKKLSK
jgi:hypothetical protein